ncbi:MAG: zinc-ribbon domain-containing protein, partial [Treponemataceae bacterium]|nr:zinc-ribbon domain-containing protein [Treponemataceae bacterium]
MKTCPNCGKNLKDEAKFCGGCGYKFSVASTAIKPESAGNVCPKCGNSLKPGAKFCGKCGTKMDAASTDSANTASSEADIAKQASFIHWNVLPGQLALKIDSQEIASYGRVKGLVIQEGLRGLVFVNGKITAELEAGSYEFKSFPDVKTGTESETKKQDFVSSFFQNIRNFFRNTPQLPANVQNVSVVLVRSVEFPLVFDVKDVATAGIRSEVGLHVLCKISNINDFYTNELIDKKFIGFESVAQKLNPLVQNILNSALSGIEPTQVASAQDKVLAAIQTEISGIYSYISATKIISLSASNEQLEEIRKLQEELYISELELTELTKRNSFLNRLQDENNAQELREARTQVEFQAALDRIDEQRELNEDERLKFSQMLEAQRLIREAKTEDEVDAAMQEFRKSGMFREEELDNLQAQINQNAALRDLSYEQALNLATL